jgi:4-amino-4-deoxy-L-arabinose transferase-like glycosyltransferase
MNSACANVGTRPAVGRGLGAAVIFAHCPAGRLRVMTKKKQVVLTVLALLATCFPLAFDLGRAPLQTWDEARQAVNAFEMLHSGGHWLVTTFAHQPDLWNTKPPLLIWLQALSMGVFGPTPLAVRLPTLLATLSTVGLLYAAGRQLGRPGLGLLAGALLVTMPGYLGPHVGRSGDYDALLSLWVLAQLLATFAYAETGRARYLALVAAALSSAVLTKGVAGLLGLPSLGLYLLLRGQLGPALRRLAFWRAGVGALAAPMLYYLLREWALPGYWAAVWANEVGGRYANTIAAVPRPWFYHLYNLLPQCWPWGLLLPLAGLLAVGPATASRRLGGLLALFLGNWLLVISLAKTKLEWYTAPMLPSLALLLALGVGAAYEWARSRWLVRGWLAQQPKMLAGALALGLVALPYGFALRRIALEGSGEYGWGGLSSYNSYLGYYRAPQRPSQLLVYYPISYYGGLQFDQDVQARRGLTITHCSPDSLPAGLAPGSRVLVCLPHLRARLRQRYAVRLLDQREVCSLYEIQGPAVARDLPYPAQRLLRLSTILPLSLRQNHRLN